MSAALKIFIIYAREDESFKNNLLTAFIPLRRTGKIEVFHDALIKPGDRWEEVILDTLRSAHIILPLVSNDFFASDFIHEVEFKNAVDRYNNGETVIMPIVLKPCGWKYDPLIKSLQVLPKDGKPVVTWTYHEEAWEQVLDAVHEVTENLEKKKQEQKDKKDAEAQRKIEEAVAKNRRAESMHFYNLGFNATDLNEKIKHYSNAIEIYSGFTEAYINRGIAKAALGLYSEAISDFDQSILINPQNSFAFHNRATAKGALKRFEEAVIDYNRALFLNPDYILAYLGRGTTREFLNLLSDAKQDYQKVLSLNPSHELAKSNLKALEVKMNQNP